MKLAYVSGPCRSSDGINGVFRNIICARSVALDLWTMGYAVICPHMNTALMDGAAPDDVWLKGDIEILKRCDLIVMLPGWTNSEGATEEFETAADYHLDVYFWPEHIERLRSDV